MTEQELDSLKLFDYVDYYSLHGSVVVLRSYTKGIEFVEIEYYDVVNKKRERMNFNRQTALLHLQICSRTFTDFKLGGIP